VRPQGYKCLTVRYKEATRTLHSAVHVGPPVDDYNSVTPEQAFQVAKTYTGIWDTGATGCVVTQKVVSECGLVPVTLTRVHHAQGESRSFVYRVSFFLPSGVAIPVVRVTQGNFIGGDVLIGMDVIGGGDFAVSLDHGKTVFSFRLPSAGAIDFVLSKGAVLGPGQKPGRNSPCPCGSGKKYKKCHGRSA